MAKIFLSWNIVSTSDVLVVAREKDDPLAEVYRSVVYHPPHSIRNETIDNINPVMHQVEIWTTVDGTTLLALKGRCDIDASLGDTVAMSIIPFIVGRGNTAPNYDPDIEGSQYVNPDLDGRTYLVFKPGFGPLQWDVNIQTITGGGFEFIDGQTFIENEEYTVLVSNVVATPPSGPGKSYPEDITTLTSSRNLVSGDYNKMIVVTGAGLLVLTITDINLIPNNTKFGLNTQAASSSWVTLQLPSGVTCNVRGTARNALYIGKGETVSFLKKLGTLYIVQWDGDVHRVGDIVYKSGLAPINSVPAIGGWISKTAQPRLAQYASELPDGMVTGATDDIFPFIDNLSKFNIGTTKIWVPDLGGYFIRSYDPNADIDPDGASRDSGSHQLDGVGRHIHKVPVGTGTGITMPDMNPNDGNTKNADALTNDGSGTATPTIVETRPKNVMQKAYIIT